MADKTETTITSVLDKTPEFWLAVLGTALYLASRNAEDAPMWLRLVKTCSAGFLALGLGPELAQWVGGKETIATVVVMTCGIFFLDIITGLLGDRDQIMKIARAYLLKRLGVKHDDVK